MGLFQRLFSKKRTTTETIEPTIELKRLRALDSFMRSLLRGDHYVAKSEYLDKLEEYKDLSGWFDVLRRSGTLDDKG